MLIVLLILIVGCSSVEKDSNETKENNEALYGQALLNLNNNSLTEKEIANLDQRYVYLQNQINDILKEEQEMSLVQFTRIKIELDFLQMQGYHSIKIIDLTANFTKAFSAAEKLIEEDYGGLSLGDRYYYLNQSISALSTNEEELKVSEYLQIENDLVQLELDGYPVLSKVNALRTRLFKAVLAELEYAIVNYEIPEVEEIEEPSEEHLEDVKEIIEEGLLNKTEETIEKESDVAEEIVEEEVEIIETGPKTHIIKLIDGGFDTAGMKNIPSEDFDHFKLNINVGDTIEWKNVRRGNYKVGLLVGNRECSNIKSGFFNTGESFNWTFDEAGTCWVSDGIFTTQAMMVSVS